MTPHYNFSDIWFAITAWIVPPPDPAPPFQTTHAVFRQFIATYTKSHRTTSFFETERQNLSFPYAWNETPTLASEPPEQPSKALCTIPQQRFYDLDQAYLRCLPAVHYNQHPNPADPVLPTLVHVWIPHPDYPQLVFWRIWKRSALQTKRVLRCRRRVSASP